MLLQLMNAPRIVLAIQAGGGGSFGGGGGGGGGFGGGFGGGGGGGDGAFELIEILIRFAIEMPIVAIPALLMVAFVVWHGARAGWFRVQDHRVKRFRLDRTGPARKDASKVLSRDSMFQEAEFLFRVRKAFAVAQDAWCAQDLAPLRAFVSDGVHERFSLQIAGQKLDGWRQGMDDVRTGKLSIQHVEAGREFDTITVRIPFQARIYRIDPVKGESILGSKLAREEFLECWTFVRRAGTTSLQGPGLIEGQCPNCGASLTGNRGAKCDHCDCLARNGSFDWVLTEITQGSQWVPEDEAKIAGMRVYQQRDPGMNAPMLEDRASVAFWRKVASDRSGSIAHLTCVASDDYCQAYAADLEPDDLNARIFFDDCAVGSVRLLGVLGGEALDRAVVEIVWDGCKARRSSGGRKLLSKERFFRRSLFVFTRKAGSTTDLRPAFTTTFCWNCSAHDVDDLEPECRYCGAARRGDRHAWSLQAIEHSNTVLGAALLAEVESLVPEIPADPVNEAKAFEVAEVSSSGLIVWSAGVVRANGIITDREREAVIDLGRRAGIPSTTVERVLTQDVPETSFRKPRNREEAHAWLLTMVRMSLVDGSICAAERSFLQQAATYSGLEKRHVGLAIQEMRSRLAMEAREAQREARAST